MGADQSRDTPDLAIEVAWTSEGLDKLEIYRRLNVAEVWLWKDGRIIGNVLDGGHYRAVDRSRLFPDLDMGLVCSLLDQPTVVQAVKALRERLRS